MSNKIIVCCENEFQETTQKIIESLKSRKYEFLNQENNFQCSNELIDSADWILYFMTKQSTGQDSHCLREIKYAQNKTKNILPIMIENVEVPPMSLQRCQWVAFTKYIDENGNFDQKYYDIKINEIDDILSGKLNKNLVHKVFISYGHDKYADLLVKKIANDLNSKGLTVWIDYDYLYGSVDWEFKIQEGIDHCRYVLFFVTEHSMRRPDGYCLNEIVYSRSKSKKIIPVSIQDIDTPISIIATPQIDFSKCIKEDGKIDENIYQDNLNKITDVLTGKTRLQLVDELRLAFQPLNNEHYIESNPKFVGREWLITQYEQWLKNDKSKVFCLLGTAGCGKTAFVSYLSDKNPNVHAIHFCIHNNSDRANPKKAILSLAYHLSRQIPQYRDALLDLPTLKDLESKNSIALFEYLFIHPLYDIDYDVNEKGPLVVIIDALDETSKDGSLQNDFINLIVNEFKKTPPWFKLVVTSRPEAEIERKLKPLNPVFINTESNENALDIKDYLVKYLTKFIDHKSKSEQEEVINTLISKSQGNFVYISKLIEDLEAVEIDEARKIINNFKNFPEGLKNKLTEYFERLFPDDGKYKYEQDIKPLMNVLCSLNQPLNDEKLSKILNISEDKLYLIKQHISSLFVVKEGCLQPFHKSILDWLPSEDSGKFHVDLVAGNKLIADYLLPLYKANKTDDYIIQHLASHCIKANLLEEAFNILIDKELLDKRIKLLGSDITLSQYFNEIYLLFQKDDSKAKEVLKHSTFLNVFGKYRKIISENEIYKDLSKMKLGSIIVDDIGLKNISLEVQLSLGYYYMSYGNYTTAWFVFGLLETQSKLNPQRELNPTLNAEKDNMLSILFYHRGMFDLAEKKAHKVIQHYEENMPQTLSDYYELIRAYVQLGDLRNLDSNDIVDYQTALNILEEAKKKISTYEENKQFTQFELEIATKLLYNQLWCGSKSILLSEFAEYASYRKQLKDIIDKFKELKEFNQTYIRCLCIDMLLNLKEHNDELVSKNYDHIMSLYPSTENKIFIEFIYTLYFYLKLDMKQVEEHITSSVSDMSIHGHFLELIKICVLDLTIDKTFSDDNIFEWYHKLADRLYTKDSIDEPTKLRMVYLARNISTVIQFLIENNKH